MGFVETLQSKKGKTFMAYLYGWGASIVIIGAMFKIQHWPGASAMLVTGLSIEAIIFFFSAFEPPHEETDWGLVYPELAHGHDDDEHMEDDFEALDEVNTDESKAFDDRPLTEQLDEMLEEAKIGPDLIESLGAGLRGLSDQTSQLNDLSNAAAATDGFVTSMEGASNSANELSKSYAKASTSIASLSVSEEDGQAYGQELQKVTQSLSALNSSYEMQLKGSTEHAETTGQLYGGISELLQNLNDSVEDTKKYKENIAELSKSLASLNTVYGNMLSAMTGGNQQG